MSASRFFFSFPGGAFLISESGYTFQPPVAPTSHNYTEIRDKLRLRLNKRQVSLNATNLEL